LTWPNSDPGPGLVGGGARAAEVLVDGAQGHELSGRARGHLWAVVAEGQQHRPGRVVHGRVDQAGLAGGDPLQQPLGLQRVTEHDLDLGGVSSTETISASHLRETRSSTTVAATPARVKWSCRRSRSTPAGIRPSPGTACGPTVLAAAAAAAAGPRAPAPGTRWPATPTPAPGRSRGGRACGGSGRPHPTPRTAR
jgi:hypothetical protein